MKKTFHLDLILHSLWIAASEHTCSGNLDWNQQRVATPHPRPQVMDAQLTDSFQNAYTAVRLELDHMSPRLRFVGGEWTQADAVVGPGIVVDSTEIPELLDYALLGSREPRYTRLAGCASRPVITDAWYNAIDVATAVTQLFGCGYGLDDTIEHDAEFLGFVAMPPGIAVSVANISAPEPKRKEQHGENAKTV